MEINETRAKRRRGRTVLTDPRTHCVSVRLNAEELKLLNNKRGNMKQGEWLRCAAIDKLPTVIPEPNIKRWSELGKIANNINQIAHKLNANKQGALIDELQINQIRQTIKELRAVLLGVNNERDAED